MIGDGTDRLDILLVEDSPGDAFLVAEMIADSGLAADLHRATTLAAATEAIAARRRDVILLDLGLPDCLGLDCVSAIRTIAPDAAILVLTGTDSVELAVECLGVGAQDYITKGEVSPYGLRRAIGYAVTRLREAAASRRIEALVDQLMRAERMGGVGTMSAGVVHDLNNMLQPILNMLPVIGDLAEDTGKSRRAIEIIRQSAERMRALIRQVLRFGENDNGAEEFVHLDAFVRDSLPLLTAGLPPAVRLTVELMVVPAIAASPSQLYQIVLNLVTNAVQAIGPRGGVVTIRVDRAADSVKLSVEDDGPGMDPVIAGRVFERHFTTKLSGAGIGLATVGDIVERMRARIELHNSPGHGVRFELSFPFDVAARA